MPLGYEVKDKHLVVNELHAVRARKIFVLYLQHGSALAVASALNQSGHKTKRHEARNGKVREARHWNKADVLRVLRNPVYAGCMGCAGELYKAEHEGLVDRTVFDRVQALLDDHAGTTRPPVNSPAYLLRGILKCGLCGRALTAASNRRNGREYRYYRCVSYSKGGKTACHAASVPAGPIEELVVEASGVAQRLAAQHLSSAVRDAMTPENRNRLVHALVREVVYNDQTGDIRVELADVRDPVWNMERRRKTGGMQKNGSFPGQTPITIGEASGVVPPGSPSCSRSPTSSSSPSTRAGSRTAPKSLGDLGVSRARVAQVLGLALLPVADQEEILWLEALDGREPGSGSHRGVLCGQPGLCADGAQEFGVSR